MSDAEPSARLRRLRRRAQRYLDNHQLTPAQAALEMLVQQGVADTATLTVLGSIQWRHGSMRKASRTLLKAATGRPPDSPGAAAELAQLLFDAGQSKAAHEYLVAAPVGASSSAAEMVLMARTLQRLGDTDVALTWMEQALARGANSASDRYFHALLLQFGGQLQVAENELDHCLTRWPHFSSAALARARIRRQTAGTNHIDQLRKLTTAAPDASVARAEFDFALFNEWHDLCEYDRAWDSLAHGNAIMAARNPHDAAAETAMVDAIIRHPATGSARTTPMDGPLPIFIVGLPRSGSTLLERLLSGHTQVASAGELDDFFRQMSWMTDIRDTGNNAKRRIIEQSALLDASELGQHYLQKTQWRADGHAFYIDKLPANFQLLDRIRRALPDAPVIHISRAPMAVCFSHLRAMFGEHRSSHSYAIARLARHYQQFRRLHEHWQQALPGAMLEVSYADLVNDTEATMRTVLTHCGVPFEAACVDPTGNRTATATPSSAQVREPIHTRGLEDWRHYAPRLQPLEQALTR